MTAITREQQKQILIDTANHVISRDNTSPYSENLRELARIALDSLDAEPVSQTYNLPELIEGMEVSIDVSTCGADAGNRYFGTITEVSELYTAKNGYILLVQDAKPNFDVNGNSPVTPDGWISCSERMPPTNVAVLVCVNGVVQKSVFCWDGESWGDWYDEYDELAQTTFTHWMPLPEPPQEVNRG